MLTVRAKARIGSQFKQCVEQGIEICTLLAGGADDSGELCTGGPLYGLVATGDSDPADGVSVTFEFSGVEVTVRRNSDPGNVFNQWYRAVHNPNDNHVGL